MISASLFRLPLRPHLGAWLVACCLILLVNTPQALADRESELQQLQENIEKLQKELKDVQGTRSGLQQELQKSESEMGELLKKIDRVQRELKEQDKQLNELNKKRDALQEARHQQQEQVAEQVRAAYQVGEQSQLKLLLNQESPERLTRMMAYHQWVFAAHSEKLDAYLNTLSQLDSLEPQIVEQRRGLQANKERLDKQQQDLKQHQSQRKKVLASINSTISTKDQELHQLQEDRQRLQALLQEVARTVGKVPLPTGGEAFSSRKGRLPWPTQGRVTSRFGSSRVGSQMQWSGMLIASNAGQAVIAVHHGRVVFADYFRGHGLLVIVDHGEGYLSLYAHNQSLLKVTGDWVKAGDSIASVGNSGGQEQSGLYFEIRHQGKPLDPAPWLARV
jgi:septal ring factor EnvC (AmiA/AmiB activator)